MHPFPVSAPSLSRRVRTALAGLFLAAGIALTAGPPAPAAAAGPVDTDRLQPGLTAIYDYMYGFVRHLDEIPWNDITRKTPHEKALPYLDHTFRNANVFDSVSREQVVMFISGFIHLDRPGDYVFVAKSNDGVRLFIEGQRILEDPDVHADRFSEPGTVSVSEPGWKPLEIQYFQRKGTAALGLYWQPPGTDNLVPVPAQAYAHLPRE